MILLRMAFLYLMKYKYGKMLQLMRKLIFDELISENHPMHVKNMASHALVFMFTSHYVLTHIMFQQPIAIFGYVGATKGRVLVQLTLQAIIFLKEVDVRGTICHYKQKDVEQIWHFWKNSKY